MPTDMLPASTPDVDPEPADELVPVFAALATAGGLYVPDEEW